MDDRVSDSVFVIHSRRMTDSQVILDLFSSKHGKVSTVFRLRGTKKKPAKMPQGFELFNAEWRPKPSLSQLHYLESSQPAIPLLGKALYCGFYVNELVERLLTPNESVDDLFKTYTETLYRLSDCGDQLERMEVLLRVFEYKLIKEIGYDINFQFDVSGAAISADRHYTYRAGSGFFLTDSSGNMADGAQLFHGENILNVGKLAFNDVGDRAVAKRIMRATLAPILGQRPLKSRELFR